MALASGNRGRYTSGASSPGRVYRMTPHNWLNSLRCQGEASRPIIVARVSSLLLACWPRGDSEHDGSQPSVDQRERTARACTG
jgi:hypothetical protein